MTRKIVAILGVAGSGKTLVARHLVEAYGFQRTRFAGPLKNMLKVGLGLTPAMPASR
jgi:dephospho-CoA kinase